ncbi:efflux transporter outer membrane subunit [Azotobacter chroococcum]|uniref:RND efflux system, outer membrane lipoprotein n=1 Tax=Azotobacter chroococcum NCIMB 8003 TaxID=1328314 RepID=A0A0C4WTY6_9GAMM|nr:efflux transporter outer membrane subunit [Azotobacter chroococcum]AJE23170.1 RND efflux system, outer membrane lipoprotein [Azotobacter chroococcum NCIMB 8003]ASL28239.1 RND transporter [Azotobacter chroococcum]TBW31775.1 efflux transporter outer membrane subunit [Azotobacter chroococcum]
MPRNLWSGLCLSSLLAVLSTLSGCINSQGILPQALRLNDDKLLTDKPIRKAARKAEWPRDRWWQAYGDPQLNAWVELALADSPDLATAAARVRQAMAMAGVAESEHAPQVKFDASVQRKHWPADQYFYGPGLLGDTTGWNNTSSLGMNYDLDLWGRLRSDTEHALSLAEVAATEERAAALELQSNVVSAYIQLALHHARLDIAEAELRQREQLLELARERLAIGIGTQLEISEAEAPLPEAHRRIDLIHEAIALTRNQLAALAGKGPGEGARLERPKLSLHGEPALPSNLPLELLGRRPDVVARRWQVAAEARGIEVAKADFYPNVNLVAFLGSGSTTGDVLNFLTNGSKLTYGIGPTLSLPVFDGGRRRGKLGAATAAYDIAVEQYNRTLVEALRGVSDQLIRLHSLHEQEIFVGHGLETAERRYKLAEEAYRRGLTDYRRVLEAQSALFDQQFLEQQVHAEHLTAQAGLWVALGGGVLTEDRGPATEQLDAHEISLHLPGRH